MTKEEAIDILKNPIVRFGRTNGKTVYAEALQTAIKALEEPQWIPCSERLPEEDGRYLVTCSRWGAWAVDWNIWSNEPKPSWLWEQGVTAWMPLPKGYKGE